MSPHSHILYSECSKLPQLLLPHPAPTLSGGPHLLARRKDSEEPQSFYPQVEQLSPLSPSSMKDVDSLLGRLVSPPASGSGSFHFLRYLVFCLSPLPPPLPLLYLPLYLSTTEC